MENIVKWNVKDLNDMKERGYMIYPCESPEEANEAKNILRLNRRCAQTGYIINKEGNKIYFVCTRERKK